MADVTYTWWDRLIEHWVPVPPWERAIEQATLAHLEAQTELIKAQTRSETEKYEAEQEALSVMRMIGFVSTDAHTTDDNKSITVVTRCFESLNNERTVEYVSRYTESGTKAAVDTASVKEFIHLHDVYNLWIRPWLDNAIPTSKFVKCPDFTAPGKIEVDKHD